MDGHARIAAMEPGMQLAPDRSMHSDCFDDEADTVLTELEFGDRTEHDPSFGCRSPKTIPPNAFTAVMPKDLDDHEAPIRKPLPRRAPPRDHGPIAYADTVKGLKPLPFKPLPFKPQPQAMIPTQVFSAETRAKRVRVLPPPPMPTQRMPSYGWIDALFGLFRR